MVRKLFSGAVKVFYINALSKQLPAGMDFLNVCNIDDARTKKGMIKNVVRGKDKSFFSVLASGSIADHQGVFVFAPMIFGFQFLLVSIQVGLYGRACGRLRRPFHFFPCIIIIKNIVRREAFFQVML